jgi:hypothetical protein
LSSPKIGDGIEFARPDVRPEHVEALVRLYWQLDEWLKRVAVVQLVQDQAGPALKPGLRTSISIYIRRRCGYCPTALRRHPLKGPRDQGLFRVRAWRDVTDHIGARMPP